MTHNCNAANPGPLLFNNWLHKDDITGVCWECYYNSKNNRTIYSIELHNYNYVHLLYAWNFTWYIIGSIFQGQYYNGCNFLVCACIANPTAVSLRSESPLSIDTKHEVYTDLLHTAFWVNHVVANFSAEANFFLRKRSHFRKKKFASADIIVCLSKHKSLRNQNTDFALSNYIVCGIKLKVWGSKKKSLCKQSLFPRG